MRRDRSPQPPSNNTYNNNNTAPTQDYSNMALVAVSTNPFANALAVPTLTQKIQRFNEKSRDCRRINISNLPFNVTVEEVKKVFLAKVTNIRKEMIDSDMARYKNDTSGIGGDNDDNNNNNNSSSSEEKKRLKYLDPNAVVEIDMITDIIINPPTRQGGSYFGYIEFLLDDIVNKIITENIPIEFVQPKTEYAAASIVQCRCRRPFTYVPMSATDDTRIYIAGIPNSVSLRDQFEEVLRSFGDVTQITAIANVGFYVEYHDALAAEKAVKGLTGFVFGERALYANFATEAFKIWLMTRGVEVTGLFQDEDLYEAANSGRFDLNYRYSNSIFAPDPLRDFYDDIYNRRVSLTQCVVNFVHTQKHLRKTWPVVTPTRILVLMNMFDPELEFPVHGNTDENRRRQIDELRTEVEDEVEKYGRVKHLFLITDPPQPTMDDDDDDDGENENENNAQSEQQQKSILDLDDYDPAEALLKSVEDELNSNKVETTQTSTALLDQPQQQQQQQIPKKVKKVLTLEEQQRRERDWKEQSLHPIFGVNGVGKVFIEYETLEEAERAQRAIAGRLFNGRTIITSYLFEDVLYPPAANDDDGDDDQKDTNASQQDAAVPDSGVETQNNTSNSDDVVVQTGGVTVTSLDEELD